MNKFSKFPADVICELHPLFKGLLWVSAARSEDETRFVLTTIHVEREGPLCHIVATDGRRLHVHTFDPGLFDTDIEMIEPGLYEVIAKTTKLIVIAPSDIGSKYPNWRNVIPEYEPEHSDSINAMTISKIGIITGVLLATDFVQDAIGFGYGRKKDSQAIIEYGSPDKSGAFVIRHDLGKAIVMPMKMFHDEEQDLATETKEPKTEKDATPDLPGFERGPIVEVAAEVLGLPAPPAEVLGLPAPEADAGEPQFVAPLTDEQKAQIEAIREAGQDCRSEGNSILENPHPFCSNERAIWREGWNMQDRFMSGTAAPSETDTDEEQYIASQQGADDDIPIGTRADAPVGTPPADETQPDPPKRPRARKAKADVVIDVPAKTPAPSPGGVEIFE